MRKAGRSPAQLAKRAALGVAGLAARWSGCSRDEAAFQAAASLQRILRPFRQCRQPSVDICFVLKDDSRGWILEAICREIARYVDGSWEISGSIGDLPAARSYFFAHYHFYLAALRRNPHLWDSRCVVWITHPKEESRDFGGPAAIRAFSRARIVSACSMWRDLLVQLGVPPERCCVVLGAADPQLFTSHQRGGGRIGLCSAYYERKRPERIIELVQSDPSKSFVLIGNGWDRCPGFTALRQLPNFEYREGTYAEYPAFYRDLDVLVSLSDLEGGPIPLVEAMMSNVVPVATRTGFAPDLIRHGVNGYLCDVDAPMATVLSLIEQALANREDVRATVVDLSWQRFSRLIQEQLDHAFAGHGSQA